MAWPERENKDFIWTDPAQDSIPRELIPDPEDWGKDKHCVMYLGKVPPDYGVVKAKEIIPWKKYREAFVKLGASELLERSFCSELVRHKDFGHLFKSKKKDGKSQVKSPKGGGYNWKEYVEAVKEAVLLDERAEEDATYGRPSWFWDEYGKKYNLCEKIIPLNTPEQIKPKSKRLKTEPSAIKGKLEYDDIGEETETAYTASGRQVKRRKIINQEGEYANMVSDDDEYDFKEDVRTKRDEKKKSVKSLLSGSKSVPKSTPTKATPQGNKSVGRIEREAERKVKDFKEEMLHKDLKKQFEAIKPIMDIDDIEKKAEYQAKFITQCKDYMNPASRELEEISGQIESLEKQIEELQQKRERLKRKREPILNRIKESVDVDLFQIIQNVWGSVEKYSWPTLMKTKLVKLMMKFKKENKAMLATHKLGRVIADIDKIVNKWRAIHQTSIKPKTEVAKAGEVKKEVKANGVSSASSKREDDERREKVAQLLSMTFGRDDFNMKIGLDLEEALFERNGRESSDNYLSSVKLVHEKLKGSTSYIPELHKGALSISAFLDNVL